MKIEIELDELGFCEKFKINGKEYGEGIEKAKINIDLKTNVDLYVNPKCFKEPELQKNDLINIYVEEK